MTFEGTAGEPGTVRLYAEGVQIGSGNSDGSEWSAETTVPLEHGVHEIRARPFDLAGNPGPLSPALTVAVDRVAPTVEITAPTNESSHQADGIMIDLGGTSSDGSGIATVEWENSRGGSGAATGTTSWMIEGLRPERDVVNDYTVRATDLAGNPGSDVISVTGVPDSESFDEFTTRHSLFGFAAREGSDPDRDGATNFEEWAQGLADPTSGSSRPPRIVRIRAVEGSDYLTMSYLRLVGGTVTGSSYEHDSAIYEARGGLGPGDWDESPVAMPPPGDLPDPPVGHEWGCFRLPTSVGESAAGFLEMSVEPAP